MSAESIGLLSGHTSESLPEDFLTVRVQRLDLIPSLTAVCAGYECGQWRAKDLARHLIAWAPDFALNYSERQRIDCGTCVEQVERAVELIFGSKSAVSGGGPGELLLHIVCRSVFGSSTAVNKVYFKTGANNEVHGFDCVHIVSTGAELELWLGEAKCHKDRSSAIRDAVSSIREHFQEDFLKSEFQLVTPKIDDTWPYAGQLRRLIRRNASLDEVFKRVTVPVLVSYDSGSIKNFDRDCAEFRTEFEAEMLYAWRSFADKIAKPEPIPVQFRLFLAPLESREALVSELGRRLLRWRQ